MTRISLAVLAAAGAITLASFADQLAEIASARRLANAERFLDDARPRPVRDGENWSAAIPWAGQLLKDGGLKAALLTVALATAGITLAAGAAFAIHPLAARNVTEPYPFESRRPRSAAARIGWSAAGRAARGALMLSRSLPEYVLGFVFVAALGPHAWSLVLALAIHNFGLLGRLGSESLESMPRDAGSPLRAAGGSRRQIFLAAMLPRFFTRFLVFASYRWETCLRDATVLGMLGFLSLGYLIVEARARQRYDEMIFHVAIIVVIVALADIASWLVRRQLRK